MSSCYTTSDIAIFLKTERRNINYYIKKKYLKAEMINNEYAIKKEDYHDFLDRYYLSDKRFSNRGTAKKLTEEQITLLFEILTDVQNKHISFNDFKEKYEDKDELIPQMKDFLLYKRDENIRHDKKILKCTNMFLANKYNLAEITIKGIINQKAKEKF